jgi:dihydrofolate reductase
MRTLSVFNSLSLDGYFTDSSNDMSWAHAGADDPEFAAFTAGNASGEGALVFGRVTYQMMAAWWPSSAAKQAMPEVAAGMNRMPKLVFSRTLDRADWENTTLLEGDPVAEMRRLKAEQGPDMVILGSGTIVSLLAGADLVDQYQLVYVPVVLGGGRTLFEGLEHRTTLRLLEERSFRNGKIVARYAPG